MPKHKPTSQAADQTTTSPVPDDQVGQFPPPEEPASPQERQPGDDTVHPQERQPGDEPPEQPKREFKPVRGWTQRFTGPLKYRKFSDADMKMIAFKFDVPANAKLPDDVLAVMRDHKQDKDGTPTGLRFQDTRKHGKVWTIPNDIEGRSLADKIDFRLSELAQKMEAAQRPSRP